MWLFVESCKVRFKKKKKEKKAENENKMNDMNNKIIKFIPCLTLQTEL